MHKDQQLSKFESYLKDRELSFKRSLSAIEQRGTEGVLDRCRVLAEQINRDLRDQKPGQLRIALHVAVNADNRRYLTAKATRAGHALDPLFAAVAKGEPVGGDGRP